MEYINREKIEEIASVTEWVDTIAEAIQTSISGDFVMPKRMHLDYGDDTFLLMPCITPEYWATKLVSFCPGNKDSGRPSIYGTVVLNSTKTGEPLAIMDGSAITALRTAAVTAVGIRALSPGNARTLGIIGTGVQGICQAVFACSVREIDEIWAYDFSEHNFKLFFEALHSKCPKIRVFQAADSCEVALNSEIIISATNSQYPVFSNERELFTGKTIIGIGSYKPDCREFPEQLFRQLDQIFVDTLHGIKESGDLIDPMNNNWIKEDNIHSLGELLSGKVVLSTNKTRLYKTVGSAIFDLFAAKLVFEKYSNSGSHISS
jgi:ornithine cyclodeaminase/alanine dehydrogenase-like protein (mu-crystallin family)